MTFRISTLLYLFAIVASSMSLLAAGHPGLAPLGLLLGFWVFWAWKCVKRDPGHYKTPIGLVKLVGVFLLLPVVACVLLQPGVSRGRPPGPYNLKHIALAIHNYHEEHGHFPPPYVADASGQPLLSWRVLILPYLEQQQLADQFRYDESWDSPHNHQLLTDLYVFRSDRKIVTGETNFVAVVADNTLWDPHSRTTTQEVSDGLDKTLLLMEIPSQGIAWSEPRDLSLDEALALLQLDDYEEQSDGGYFIVRKFRVRTAPTLVATADGAVHSLPPGLDHSDAMALLTGAGGEPIEPLDSPQRRHERRVVEWGRVISAGLWIAIVLLPLSRRLAIFPTPST